MMNEIFCWLNFRLGFTSIGLGLHLDEQGIPSDQLLWEVDIESVGGPRRRLPDLLLVRC